MSDAELARGRRGWWNPRVLGEFPARVEREDQAAVELEYHDRSSCFGVASFVLVGNHPLCGQAESVTVERERTPEVVDGERDDMHARLH
jgi:hypothetical protein